MNWPLIQAWGLSIVLVGCVAVFVVWAVGRDE